MKTHSLRKLRTAIITLGAAALVDKINTELAAENTAVTLASSNLVAATFITPKDSEKIADANPTLAKARKAWAAKASRLVTHIQASDQKLSDEALAQLVANASGRGGGAAEADLVDADRAANSIAQRRTP